MEESRRKASETCVSNATALALAPRLSVDKARPVDSIDASKRGGYMRIAIFVAFALAIVPSASQANCFTDGLGRASCTGPVGRIYVGGTVITFEVATTSFNPIPCAYAVPTSPGTWQLSRTDPAFEERYSLLLTAKAVGIDVDVTSITTGGATCQIEILSTKN